MPQANSRPRKHLMVPGEQPKQRTDSMSLGTVQKWVLSTLAVSTIFHLAAGLVIAAVHVEERGSKIGLLAIAGAFGVIAIAVGLLIHERRPLSPWLVLGLLPPVVGALVVL